MKSIFNLTTLGLASAAATLALAPAAQAANMFGVGGISFDTDTTVQFTFEEARGGYTSALGIYTVGESGNSLVETLFAETDRADKYGGDWLSTCGGENSVVANCTFEFTFQKDIEYVLGLNSGSSIVYSTSLLNTAFAQKAVFDDEEIDFEPGDTIALDDAFTEKYTKNVFEALTAGVWIGFDDGGHSNDVDFQDFVISAVSVPTESVPEPASALALMAVGGAALKLRRRNDA